MKRKQQEEFFSDVAHGLRDVGAPTQHRRFRQLRADSRRGAINFNIP